MQTVGSAAIAACEPLHSCPYPHRAPPLKCSSEACGRGGGETAIFQVARTRSQSEAHLFRPDAALGIAQERDEEATMSSTCCCVWTGCEHSDGSGGRHTHQSSSPQKGITGKWWWGQVCPETQKQPFLLGEQLPNTSGLEALTSRRRLCLATGLVGEGGR